MVDVDEKWSKGPPSLDASPPMHTPVETPSAYALSDSVTTLCWGVVIDSYLYIR